MRFLLVSLCCLLLSLQAANAASSLRFKVLEDGTIQHIQNTLVNNAPEEYSPLLRQAINVVASSDSIKAALKDLPMANNGEIEFSQDNFLALAKMLLSGESINAKMLEDYLNSSPTSKANNSTDFDWSYESFVTLAEDIKAYITKFLN